MQNQQYLFRVAPWFGREGFGHANNSSTTCAPVTSGSVNSSNNPANRDPNKEVRWGPQTFDEMHLGYIEYIVPGAKPGDPNPLSPRGRVGGAIRNFFGGSNSAKPNVGDALFQQLDTDGNGSVSRDEVKAKYENNPAASTTIFDRLDSDKNGQLSQQELRKLAEVIGR